MTMDTPEPMRADLPLFARARQWGDAPALFAPEGEWSYGDLLAAAETVARGLLGGGGDLAEEPIPFLAPPGLGYTALLWGIWRAGGIAVPLCTVHPPAELAYVLRDTGARRAIAHPDLADRLGEACRQAGIELLTSPDRPVSPDRLVSPPSPILLPSVTEERRALIIYTSGTTSHPKGAVWTHRGLRAQVETLTAAWGWERADRALLVLPLHHVHGLVNVLATALWSGARCEIAPRFDPTATWRRLASGEITVFMAVPTLYYRLIAAWDEAPPAEREAWSAGARGLRLLVSGSAALPVQTLHRFRELTGHTLLERYGMTEIGMALSNPYLGERLPGAVGSPLPGVEVRLVDERGKPVGEGKPGEIEVRGPGIFREYWNRPEATREAFRGGWFHTGDAAVVEGGSYRILGRQSVDIIKSGGYKISALEVEAALRDHPAIADCAVVGITDPEWGERVAVAVVPAPRSHPPFPAELTLETLRVWARDRLAPYKLPTRMHLVEELPRNALGKVIKPRLIEEWLGAELDGPAREPSPERDLHRRGGG